MRLWNVAPAALLLTLGVAAHADTVNWAAWTSDTTGTIGSINVSYSGQTSGLLINYPSWGPSSSYVGGTVGNAPPKANNAVAIEGGTNQVETITFSSPVVDPYLAIWSLGEPGDPTSFVFTAAEPFTIESGGPSNEFGGSALTLIPDGVSGSEGNGIIQFDGTFSSITFTTPQYENYYAFTVGNDATAANTTVTPEPGTLSLLGLGLGAVSVMRRRFSRAR